jgi:hypothetical protein
VFSRAYINFKTADDLFDFKDKFHGHVFVSNKGNQYVCSVEYAPNQKVPKPVEKKDPRDGTIERGRRLLGSAGCPGLPRICPSQAQPAACWPGANAAAAARACRPRLHRVPQAAGGGARGAAQRGGPAGEARG